MARDYEKDVRIAHPDLLQPDEAVTGMFGALHSQGGMATVFRMSLRKGKTADQSDEGIAATIPVETKFAMVTSNRVIFFGGRATLGRGAPTEVLLQVPANAVQEIEFFKKGDYTRFSFTDGSSISLLTNASRQLRDFGRNYLGVDKPFRGQTGAA